VSAANAEPLYRQIVKRLAADIAIGALKPNGQLPTENQLMERFGVSRATVRRAIDDLVRDGLICRHRGRGTFVADTWSQSALPPSGRDQQKYLGVVVSYIGAPRTGALLSGLERGAKSHGFG
jgi:DNA-binding GntR family transcriptional regulator